MVATAEEAVQISTGNVEMVVWQVVTMPEDEVPAEHDATGIELVREFVWQEVVNPPTLPAGQELALA